MYETTLCFIGIFILNVTKDTKLYLLENQQNLTHFGSAESRKEALLLFRENFGLSDGKRQKYCHFPYWSDT